MPKQLVEFLTPERLLTWCWIVLGLETLDPKCTFAEIVELPKTVIHLRVPEDHQGVPKCCDSEYSTTS